MLLDQLPGKVREPLARLLDGDPLSVGEKRDEKSGSLIKDVFRDLVANVEEIARDILAALRNIIFKVAAGELFGLVAFP